jgi:hypothetical protein
MTSFKKASCSGAGSMMRLGSRARSSGAKAATGPSKVSLAVALSMAAAESLRMTSGGTLRPAMGSFQRRASSNTGR